MDLMNLRIVVNCNHDTNDDINGRHGEIVSYSVSKETHYILCRLDRVDDETPAVLVPLTIGCVRLDDDGSELPPATPDSFKIVRDSYRPRLAIADRPRAKKRTSKAK